MNIIDSTISTNPFYSAAEQIGNFFKPGFELIPRIPISESQQNAALAGGIVLAIVEPGPSGEGRILKNIGNDLVKVRHHTSLTDSMISMNPISNAIEQIGNLFKPGFELIPRTSISASQQKAALAGGLGFAIIEPGPAGEARLLKNVAKNGMIIKQTSSKVDYLFKNRNDAMNWARNQLGHNTTKIFDSRGKWIGWGSEKGKVYWSHNDWITGMGSSKFPHLNYNFGVKGHLFLGDKINNVGLWETFLNYFR